MICKTLSVQDIHVTQTPKGCWKVKYNRTQLRQIKYNLKTETKIHKSQICFDLLIFTKKI